MYEILHTLALLFCKFESIIEGIQPKLKSDKKL